MPRKKKPETPEDDPGIPDPARELKLGGKVTIEERSGVVFQAEQIPGGNGFTFLDGPRERHPDRARQQSWMRAG